MPTSTSGRPSRDWVEADGDLEHLDAEEDEHREHHPTDAHHGPCGEHEREGEQEVGGPAVHVLHELGVEAVAGRTAVAGDEGRIR